MKSISLYRLFDADDHLMYIGVTKSFGARLDQHRATWRFGATKIARWDLEEYATRDEALVAEAIAIRDENPRFNIANNLTLIPRDGFDPNTYLTEPAVAVADAIATPTGIASASGPAGSTTAKRPSARAHADDRVRLSAEGVPGEPAVHSKVKVTP